MNHSSPKSAAIADSFYLLCDKSGFDTWSVTLYGEQCIILLNVWFKCLRALHPTNTTPISNSSEVARQATRENVLLPCWYSRRNRPTALESTDAWENQSEQPTPLDDDGGSDGTPVPDGVRGIDTPLTTTG